MLVKTLLALAFAAATAMAAEGLPPYVNINYFASTDCSGKPLRNVEGPRNACYLPQRGQRTNSIQVNGDLADLTTAYLYSGKDCTGALTTKKLQYGGCYIATGKKGVAFVAGA